MSPDEIADARLADDFLRWADTHLPNAPSSSPLRARLARLADEVALRYGLARHGSEPVATLHDVQRELEQRVIEGGTKPWEPMTIEQFRRWMEGTYLSRDDVVEVAVHVVATQSDGARKLPYERAAAGWFIGGIVLGALWTELRR